MGNRKDWKKTKEIHWSDEKNQDFNEIGLKRKGVPQNYKYIRKSPIYWFFSHLLYYVIAKPLLWPYIFLHGVRTKNKKALKAFIDFKKENNEALNKAKEPKQKRKELFAERDKINKQIGELKEQKKVVIQEIENMKKIID